MPDVSGSPERFGPYLVYERLGAGGMATVHRAVQTGIEGFERPVALKRLLSQYAGDQDFVRGFVREARLASRLQHAHIAQTYDLGRVDHTYYIAMELVDGVDLRHVLRHLAYSVGPMPPAVAIALLVQVCDALDYAHTFTDETGRALGIVHRDVSPSNVIVGRDGVVKIIDFGIAKATSATLFTASGVLKGKFSYMAPEALDGHTDARGDLFAVGVVLHELLTARPLFKGATDFDTLEQIKRMHPPPPSSVNPAVPAELDRIVLTALAKNPTQRWSSAAILRQALLGAAALPGLRASHLDAARWIEWAMAQPARAYAWDEAPPPGAEPPSIELEVSPATQIGAAPVPRAARPSSGPLVATPAALGYAPTTATPSALGYAPTTATPALGHAPTAATPALGYAPTTATPALGYAPTAATPALTPALTPTMAAPGAPAAPARTVLATPTADAPTLHVEPLRPVVAAPRVAGTPHPAAGTPHPAQPAAAVPTVSNPLASPEYQAAAAAYNELEERRAQMANVVALPAAAPDPAPADAPASGGGAGWVVLVLLLCAGAAVGGFFLVDALL